MWPHKSYFWPDGVPFNAKLETFIKALAIYGYSECENDTVESGFEKVVLYGSADKVEHASRQLPNGRWTSKLGQEEDIEHDVPKVVADGLYGPVLKFFKRPAQPEPEGGTNSLS